MLPKFSSVTLRVMILWPDPRVLCNLRWFPGRDQPGDGKPGERRENPVGEQQLYLSSQKLGSTLTQLLGHRAAHRALGFGVVI